MNALRAYRKQTRQTLGDLAAQLDISPGSLSRIERGEQWPDRQFFERITVVSGGKVAPNDFLQPPAPANEGASA